MNKTIESAINFVKNIDDEAAIIYDNDGDGISSAAIIAKALTTLRLKAIVKTSDKFFISGNIFQKIKNFKSIITLDIPFDEEPKYILKLAKKSKILVIDHHQIHQDLNKHKNIIYFNPELLQTEIPSYKYCVSKIVYDILSRIIDVKNFDWLAAIGIVNDMCMDKWEDFLNSVYKKYKITFSDIKLINDIINSGYYYSGNKGVEIAYKACLEASSPMNILNVRTPNSKKLKTFYNKIEREIKASSKWKKNAEIFEDKKLIILKLNTKFSVNSPISTKISLEKPNYTVIVTRKKDNMIFISLRRQDKKVNCSELAGKATRNLKNSKGGGHTPAAGASIMSKDWKVFRKRILELL